LSAIHLQIRETLMAMPNWWFAEASTVFSQLGKVISDY
jgi:hypothetical protein